MLHTYSLRSNVKGGGTHSLPRRKYVSAPREQTNFEGSDAIVSRSRKIHPTCIDYHSINGVLDEIVRGTYPLIGVVVLWCYVMLCYVMLCYVMLCYVMLCYVMLCYVMLCYVML